MSGEEAGYLSLPRKIRTRVNSAGDIGLDIGLGKSHAVVDGALTLGQLMPTHHALLYLHSLPSNNLHFKCDVFWTATFVLSEHVAVFDVFVTFGVCTSAGPWLTLHETSMLYVRMYDLYETCGFKYVYTLSLSLPCPCWWCGDVVVDFHLI